MKYPVLMTVTTIQIIGGWVAVGIGVIMILLGLAAVSNGQQNPYGAMAGVAQLTTGFGLAIAGLFMVHAGEVSKVLTDIEANTARSAEALVALRQVQAPAPIPPASAPPANSESLIRPNRCAHDWQVEQENRDSLQEQCVRCGATRTFARPTS